MLLIILAAGGLSAPPLATERVAGAFNIRIVSDSVPDWSSRENFVRSALSGWTTDEEKALAQFLWSYRCRRVGTYAPENGMPVLDPILFFNNYGITYCSMISSLNCALWEAWGKKSRCIDLPGHVVSEVFYGGSWHMYDNDFFNYFINEKGAVASVADLAGSRVHGNVADLRPGEYYVFDHCPTASAPRDRIYMGPSSATLTNVAQNWYPSPDRISPRPGLTGGDAGFRQILQLRPHESYTRYWKPIGFGDAFARPLAGGEGDPMEKGSVLRNSRSNGEWEWAPDLGDPRLPFAAENAVHSAEGIAALDAGKAAAVVFRIMAGNVITSAHIDVGFSGQPDILVSANNGVSWTRTAMDTYKSGAGSVHLAGLVAGRIEYLVKVTLAQGATLKALSIRTATQVNPRALPALRLGRNDVVVVRDSHLETLTFMPRLDQGAISNEVHRASGWETQSGPGDKELSVRAAGESQLVLKANAPGAVRKIRMSGTAAAAGGDLLMELSIDDGTHWIRIGAVSPDAEAHGQRFSFEHDSFPPDLREVLMRYGSNSGTGRLARVFAEAGYVPDGRPMPIAVTYCWSEHRDGLWVERRHTEIATNAWHRYGINVGGDRPPRMEWLRMAPADGASTGYSDEADAGEGAAHAAYRLSLGALLSTGCTYAASRPASGAFPDVGNRLLTDGHVGVASFWGLDNVNVKTNAVHNRNRVGDLVVWEAGAPVTIAIDLGAVRRVGGVRICAVQPNREVLYPARMTAGVSMEGTNYAAMGEARWEDCFFPPINEMPWEGFDSPLYDSLPAAGRLDFKFAISAGTPLDGRYVRVVLQPPEDDRAGVALWEVQVFDSIRRSPWDDRIVLPEKAAR